jgi:hypothetical protein
MSKMIKNYKQGVKTKKKNDSERNIRMSDETMKKILT